MSPPTVFVLCVLAFNAGFLAGAWWATLPFDDDPTWKDHDDGPYDW